MIGSTTVPCSNCGQSNPPGQKFCGECGVALVAACLTCGSGNPPDQHFCGQCGAALLVPCPRCSGVNPTAQKFCGGCGAPLVVPAPVVAANVVAGEPVLAGSESSAPTPLVTEERRLITALFCDLVGFTPLSESLDAEEVRMIQGRYFAQMSAELHRFGGSVEKYAGDAVLALFGVPIAHEDDAERAVRCALAMQEAFKPVADMAKREWGRELAVRIGVNTGEVVSGAWDVEGRLDYSATGDALNTAARLQTAADPGGVIVGPETMHLARRAIRFGPRRDLTLKGKSELFPAYPVLGLRAEMAERWELREYRSPLVGREGELSLLLEAYNRVESGENRMVTLVAEAGVGKSRLLAEAVERMSSAGTVLVRGRCLSHGQGMSLHLVADLLRSICQLHEGDSQERIRAHLRTAVDALLAPHEAETRDAAADVLGTVLGLPPGPSTVTRASPQVRWQTLVRSVRLLLAAEAAYRPAILLLEDLHWADQASIELLESALPALRQHRALVLVTHRPGFSAPWSEWPESETVHLEPLGEGNALALARAVLGRLELEPELDRQIMERAGGNPFFTEELLRSMRETGALVERDGRVGLLPGAAEKLPSTLTELLLARLDQLDRPARSAAQCGSVIGRIFAVPLLARITEQREERLQAPLTALERAEIAFPRREAEREYMFKHATVREVAYNALLLRRRQALHAATARGLIDLYPADEHVDTIAYHFSRTREHGEAALWLERSGDRAAAVFANAEAIEQYREARRRQDLVAAEPADRARVEAKLGHILRIVVRFDEGLEALEAALQGYRSERDAEGERRVTAEIGRLHRARGTAEEAIPRIRQLLETPASPSSGLAALHVVLARLYYTLGRYHEQLEAATRGSEMAISLADRRVLAEAEMSRSVALYHLSRTGDALQAMVTAIPVAEEVEDFESLANLLNNTGMIYRDVGDFERSRHYRERWAHIAERTGDPTGQAAALSNLGELLFCLGDWDQAQASLERALAILRTLERSWFSSQALSYLGQLHAARGQFDTSSAYLHEALAIVREGANHLLLLLPVAFLAEMERLRGRPDLALEHLQEIMDFSQVDPEDSTLTGVLPIAAAALFDTGEIDRAAELATLGAQRAVEEQSTVEGIACQRVLGAVAASRGEWESARAIFEQTLTIAREITYPYAEARTLHEYGLMHLKQGDRVAARARLEEALHLFQRLGARPYIKRVERALVEISG